MLAHLAYVSVRKTNCTDVEIDRILQSCKKNNPPLNITGVLLYSQTKFIQYVEGESQELMKLYDRIKKDERHEKVVMISYAPIVEKIFPSWHMGSRKFSSGEIDYATDITSSDRAVFEKIMNAEEEEGSKVQSLLTKLFKNNR